MLIVDEAISQFELKPDPFMFSKTPFQLPYGLGILFKNLTTIDFTHVKTLIKKFSFQNWLSRHLSVIFQYIFSVDLF